MKTYADMLKCKEKVRIEFEGNQLSGIHGSIVRTTSCWKKTQGYTVSYIFNIPLFYHLIRARKNVH